MDYSEVLAEIVEQMKVMNGNLKEISDDLQEISCSLQSGDARSIAEEILEK